MNQIDSETVSFAPDDAVLVLEDGQVYVGDSYGAIGKTTGEIVFATGMTGYQETLTDPSYDRQIVVQTFPHIGDTGINREDPESSRIWVAGYVVRDPSPTVSNWRATGSLDDDLVAERIVGISHIDTRKLVRHLRSAGVMRAGIFSGDALLDDEGHLKTVAALIDEVKATPQMKGLSLYDEVSTKETYTVEPCGEYEGKEPLYTVAAVDLGVKGMTPHRMAERGCRVHVVPSTITFEELTALNPDGVFFSNGPGDPEQADPEVELLRKVLPATRKQVSSTVQTCGFPIPTTAQEWGRQVMVLKNLRRVLDVFQPEIFERDIDSMIEATKPKAQRKAEGSSMGFWERRRHIKEAKSMLRVGAQVENLHEALLVVAKQAEQWHMFVPHGGWPVLPAKLDDIINTQDQLTNDMTALNVALATTPQGGNLDTVDLNQVEERLKALYDDKQALDTLPELSLIHI